jgi:hypothetical protein
MHENEQLKSVTEDLKRKSNEAEVESLREEYHQRVATLERKVLYLLSFFSFNSLLFIIYIYAFTVLIFVGLCSHQRAGYT